jgi:hypothetical protein
MLIWGGFIDPNTNAGTNTGAAYNPATNLWRILPLSGLSARYQGSLGWTGSEFIVWSGGISGGIWTIFDDGARYSPASDSWMKLPSPGRLGAQGSAAAWTGSELLLFGGDRQAADTWRNDLWSYTPPRTLYLYQRN